MSSDEWTDDDTDRDSVMRARSLSEEPVKGDRREDGAVGSDIKKYEGLDGSDGEDRDAFGVNEVTPVQTPRDLKRNNTFPMNEYNQVAEGLSRCPNWTVYPGPLSRCIVSAVGFLKDEINNNNNNIERYADKNHVYI